MTDLRIETPDDLHRVLRDHWEGRYLFRGEDSADYTLRPKYGRAQAKYPSNTAETEQELLREFKRRSVPHLSTMPRNDWEWLAIAQHFGLATRLLDWTENPLIAAYFATLISSPWRSRVLYMLNIKGVDEADIETSPFDLNATVVYSPAHTVRRLTAQAGFFTVHPNPAVPFSSEHLERWVIDADAAAGIHVTLLSYGINEASIFEDLDGLARYLNLTILTGGSEPSLFRN